MGIINVDTLNNSLINNVNNIKKVLIKIGFDSDKFKYNDSQHLLTSPRPEGDNLHGVLIYVNSLKVVMTTRSFSGNIYTLVMKYKECNFPRSLELIAGWIGIKEDDFKLTYPFNHFYKNLIHDKCSTIVELDSYPEDILRQYCGLSKKYLLDGVDLKTQEKFEISFSHEDNAISIPVRDMSGRLVGVKMRNNDPNCDFSSRFWSSYKYSKNSVLYGLYNNYPTIVKKNKIIICEAEKSVLQANSFGCNIITSIGGHCISNQQAAIIKSCMVDKVIVAFDSDICYEEAEYEAKKLIVNNSIYSNSVGVLNWNNINKLNDKISPTDCGRDYFADCMKEVQWIG